MRLPIQVEAFDTNLHCLIFQQFGVHGTLAYGLHQRENIRFRLFIEVKPCWTALITGWATLRVLLYSLGSQAGAKRSSIPPPTSTRNVVRGLSFSRSQPNFEGFLRVLRIPRSPKNGLFPFQVY